MPDKKCIPLSLCHSTYYLRAGVSPNDDTNTGCTVHDAYVRNLNSLTFILYDIACLQAWTYIIRERERR